MKEKYEYLAFKYFFEQMHLEKLENVFLSNGVKPYKNINLMAEFPEFSKYFFLINLVDESKLVGELKSEYEFLLKNNSVIDIISNSELNKKVNNFIERSFKQLLIPDTDEKYLYHGNTTYAYMAPSDAIVLGFKYKRYDYENDELFEETEAKIETLLCDSLNKIQYEIGPSVGIKTAVIKYDELYINNPFLKI